MKTSFLLFLCLLETASAEQFRYVLLPPFENLTSRKAQMAYLINPPGSSSRPATVVNIDRYSHVPREILEDIVANIPGVRPIERQRLDQFYSEAGLLRPNPITSKAFIDGEVAKNAMVKLSAPVAVQGSILQINESKFKYRGYTDLDGIHWTTTVRVRIYHLENGKLEIPYSRILSGTFTQLDDIAFKSQMPEEDLALNLITSALEILRGDEAFSNALLSGNPTVIEEDMEETPVLVPFDITPKDAAIYIDDHFEGRSPCQLRLMSGRKVLLRVERAGYVPWKTSIIPRKRLKVSYELERIADVKNGNEGEVKP